MSLAAVAGTMKRLPVGAQPEQAVVTFRCFDVVRHVGAPHTQAKSGAPSATSHVSDSMAHLPS